MSPGHALIIPKRHVASYFDLTNHERESMNVMLQYVKQRIDEEFHPDGYNVGINVNEAGEIEGDNAAEGELGGGGYKRIHALTSNG